MGLFSDAEETIQELRSAIQEAELQLLDPVLVEPALGLEALSGRCSIKVIVQYIQNYDGFSDSVHPHLIYIQYIYTYV